MRTWKDALRMALSGVLPQLLLTRDIILFWSHGVCPMQHWDMQKQYTERDQPEEVYRLRKKCFRARIRPLLSPEETILQVASDRRRTLSEDEPRLDAYRPGRVCLLHAFSSAVESTVSDSNPRALLSGMLLPQAKRCMAPTACQEAGECACDVPECTCFAKWR